MESNFSKFKYSYINKIICVILCLVTFLIGSFYAVLSATSIVYKFDSIYSGKSQATDDWTNSFAFYRLLYSYSTQSVLTATERQNIEYLQNKYEKNKEKYIDEAYNIVLNLKKEAENNPDVDVNSYYDETRDEYVTETTTYYNYQNHTNDYFVYVDGLPVCEFHLSADMSKDDIIELFNINDGNIKRNFEYLYLNDNMSAIDTSPFNECKYYAKLNETESTNTENFDEKDVYRYYDYYFISKKGELKYRGICDELAEDVYSRMTDNIPLFKDTDFYLFFNVKDLSDESIVDSLLNYSENEFSQLYSFSKVTKKACDDLTKNIVIASCLLAISFASGFMYFSVTGKKDKESKSKLFFYDYIPLEIGLTVAFGIGAGIFALLLDTVWNTYAAAMISVYGIWCFAMLVQILLFFICASFARYTKSGRKFYKHLLTYWILFALWKILIFIFKCIKFIFKAVLKFFRKLKASAVRSFNAFIFKTHQFKRNILTVAIAWLAVNLLACGIIIVCSYSYHQFFAFILAVGIFVLDFFTFRKLGEYVKNLDTIIDAASRHEEVLIDLDKLDNSLKTLAESMRYTNAELQNAIAKAVKDERLRTELITNVSHDLKTPLTSIITYVDLLSKCDIDDEKAQEYIKVLDDKGAKLKRLIDDLIEASKVTSGNVTVNLTPMNLSELCLQATVDVQADFEKAGLDLVVKSGEKPITVIADGTKANRIIENLLSNARKYSAKASRVYVRVYNEGDYGVFEIKNISAQALDITPEELTERFVRGDKSRNRDGNGLGLSIAKELCKLQNGKLELIIDGDLFKARVKFPNKQ